MESVSDKNTQNIYSPDKSIIFSPDILTSTRIKIRLCSRKSDFKFDPNLHKFKKRRKGSEITDYYSSDFLIPRTGVVNYVE